MQETEKKSTVRANREAYQTRAGQMIAEAGATPRHAKVITRGGLQTVEGINNRELKQRDASRADAAEAKSSLEAVSHRMHEHAKAFSKASLLYSYFRTGQSVRKLDDRLGENMIIRAKRVSN